MRSNSFIGKRVIALSIDLIILSQIAVLVNNFVKLNYELEKTTIIDFNVSYGFSLMFILYVLYFLLFDFLYKGVTLGKKIIGISIESKNANNGFKKELLKRTLIKLVSIFILPVSIVCYLFFNIIFQDYLFPELYTTDETEKSSVIQS